MKVKVVPRVTGCEPLLTVIRIVPRDKICGKCRVDKARPGQRWCWRCHAINKRKYKHRMLSPVAKRKVNARRMVNSYIQRGKVKPGVCEVCGSGDVQPHHEDYSKPLQVRWFCREHHLEHEGKVMRKPSVVNRYEDNEAAA